MYLIGKNPLNCSRNRCRVRKTRCLTVELHDRRPLRVRTRVWWVRHTVKSGPFGRKRTRTLYKQHLLCAGEIRERPDKPICLTSSAFNRSLLLTVTLSRVPPSIFRIFLVKKKPRSVRVVSPVGLAPEKKRRTVSKTCRTPLHGLNRKSKRWFQPNHPTRSVRPTNSAWPVGR